MPVSQTVLQSAEQMQAQLLARAGEESAFRTQLLADPKEAIRQEYGTVVPDFIDIQVHQTDPNVIHMVLPPDPDVELDEERLEAIAAGLCCCY